ncbi:MAG: flagellar filament capping protein FliD [Firmicutes bacterium]|nr:flagellar filament capping protein FliD [Bacillota bacterium]
MMRISGLNSGMDTEQIIKDIMTVQRIPVDKVFQQKVKAEWKRDAYRDINMKLSRFRNFAFDMRLSNTLQKFTASSSRTDVLTATATGRAQAGTYDLEVKQLAKSAQQIAENVSFPKVGDGEDFKIGTSEDNMVEIEIKETDTLADIAARINSKKELGISAFAHGDSISFTTNATGADATIVGDNAFVEIFGNDVTNGQDAIVTINGLETEQSSNTFDVNGVTVNLLDAPEGAKVRIEVRQDVDAVVDKVKEFVNMYNELIDELNAATREEVYRDFPPLTDAQRADLSDKEIELWEEKAKSGLLRSDSMISGFLSEMRIALGAGVKDKDRNTISLAQIGITTGSWFEYGRLHVNEDKLRSAIEENPEAVQNLFAQGAEEGSEPGISRKLTSVLDNAMKRLDQTAGKASISYDQSFLGERIRDYESRLSAMEERLLRYEESQWAKFAAMERVLGQLYSQGDWLTQQLMSMQG